MNGFDNEFTFVMALNNKKIKDINPLLQNVIYEIFDNVYCEDIIKCWRNHKKQKSDIFIKINNVIKGISIKYNNKDSIHTEHIGEFCNFLYSLGASKDMVKGYLAYHFADGTTNGKGIIRQSAIQYKKYRQFEIDIINKFLNTDENVSKAIERFVIKGNNSDYDIDGIICGQFDDFVWINKKDIKKVLLSKINEYSSTIHFSSLICQPLNRCLNYNNKYSYGRFYVQIKWYNLLEDIKQLKCK